MSVNTVARKIVRDTIYRELLWARPALPFPISWVMNGGVVIVPTSSGKSHRDTEKLSSYHMWTAKLKWAQTGF